VQEPCHPVLEEESYGLKSVTGWNWTGKAENKYARGWRKDLDL
jgi:hypothetical protein